MMKRGHIYILLFFCELSVLVYAYCYGKDGLNVLVEVQKQKKTIETKIEKIEIQIAEFQYQIEKWHTNDFYIERFAREQLQMARPGDAIYYRS